MLQAFFYWNDVTGDEPLRGTPEPAQDGLGGGVVALLDGEGGGGDDANLRGAGGEDGGGGLGGHLTGELWLLLGDIASCCCWICWACWVLSGELGLGGGGECGCCGENEEERAHGGHLSGDGDGGGCEGV